MAYSDAISTMLNLFSSFTDDKMIPKPITVHNNFIIILSQYIIFTCSHITFAMVDSFYFLCFGSGRNEYNSFWAGKGGAVRSLLFARKMYHPEDSVFSLTNSKNNGGCHFTKKVQKSPLYLSYILIQERCGILAARCALYITYGIRFEKKRYIATI